MKVGATYRCLDLNLLGTDPGVKQIQVHLPNIGVFFWALWFPLPSLL